MLTIPPYYNEIAFATSFSGAFGTERYRGSSADGATVQIDIIQSVPKNGRWRHVARCTHTAKPTGLAGVSPDSTTVTITFDHPNLQAPSQTATLIKGFFAALDSQWDEIASGQQ